MLLFKIIFTLVIIGIMCIMGVVIRVHSKYENIIINMSHNDKLTTENGSVVEIDRVCSVLMNVYYYDSELNYHEVTWTDFMKMMGTYNLAKSYGKSYRKIDKIIMGF